jgi:membrane-bound lytic murein transglycosylase D
MGRKIPLVLLLLCAPLLHAQDGGGAAAAHGASSAEGDSQAGAPGAATGAEAGAGTSATDDTPLPVPLAAPLALLPPSSIPRPKELEPDVRFWIRVYTEITTNEGFLHDQWNLAVVYTTLHFEQQSSPRERQRKVDEERERIAAILRRLGHGEAPADTEAQHIRDLWGADATPARLAQAADDLRFQLGQADRFRAGLARSGAWETHIAEVLANNGLPAEIAALPHVESSFDPSAYSKVGAAGLWQFMRSTGRRFLRIDSSVDERMDPFRETEAAAQLLSYNYRLLGNWPLAITAYNHGAEGMRRARDQLGDDIVRIVRQYRSPSFGFASRNFYVSFLAALTVDQNPEKYFGHLDRGKDSAFQELKLLAAAPAGSIERTLGVDRALLRSLNPALRPPVWNGQRPVPAGYVLRLPVTAQRWTSELLAQRLGGPAALLAVAEKNSRPAPASEPGNYYVVQRGDNISSIATHTGVAVNKLMALNSLRDQDYIYEGQRLRLVAAAAEPETVTTPAEAASAQTAVREEHEDEQAVEAANKVVAHAQPVTASQAEGEGPQLIPGTEAVSTADPVDYSVSADDTIRVVAAETLGHYADWLGTSAARLRALNKLRGRTAVVVGHRVKLEFTTVSREQFEQRRRGYHERLEAAYFSSHRIAGTEVYIARRGDSLWSITARNVKVPIWLLQQYNPDLDFNDLRPGTQIAMPRVEDVSAP